MELQLQEVLLPAALAVVTSLVICSVAALRMRQGKQVLPYQPRRLVPWQGIDLLMVLAVYGGTLAGVSFAAEVWLGPEFTRPPAIQDIDQTGAAHMVIRLLVRGDPWVLLLCGLSAAVAAPIVEEFLFRVLLQGWLESGQRRLRPAMPTLRRWVPGAVGPIILTSLLFGRVHFRVAGPMMHPRLVTFMLAGQGLAGLLTMVLVIGILRLRVGVTAADLGWVPKKLSADVRLGLLTFAALAAPIYAAQFTLATLVLPKYLAPDPFVLFFFALALGTLYYRTHRIVPSIVLHMALNTSSLLMAWYAFRQ